MVETRGRDVGLRILVVSRMSQCKSVYYNIISTTNITNITNTTITTFTISKRRSIMLFLVIVMITQRCVDSNEFGTITNRTTLIVKA